MRAATHVSAAPADLDGTTGTSPGSRAGAPAELGPLPGPLGWGMLEAVVHGCDDAIVGVTRDGVVRVWNEAATRLYGYLPEEVIGRPAAAIMSSDDAAREESFTRVLRGEEIHGREKRTRAKDGSQLDVMLTLLPVFGRRHEVVGLIGISHDMRMQRRVESELRHHLDHDPLTGLFNRTRLIDEIERCLAYNRSLEVEGALLALDIDNFNIVNDSEGHAGGDRLLLNVAEMLRAYARDADLVGRIGGDEFALVLPEATPRQAMEVAAELRGRLAAAPGGPVRASIGVACSGPDGEITADDLLVAADMALHDAESAGGDRAVLYAGTAGSALAQVEAIRGALAEERLTLYGQPIVRLSDGSVACHELLVRMVDHRGRLIPPSEFIPVAERFGLVHEIDAWVMARALEMAGRGRPVAVNLSGASIGDPELLWLVRAGVGAGVPCRNLIIEVTETAAIDRLPAAIDFADELSRLGCSLALDDFGTGYGSFTYLKHLKSRFVKIDIEFVSEILDSRTDREVVRSIVDVAHALGKLTIAEGIEDAATLQAVRTLGVDFAQGFHIGRPAPLA